MVVKFLLPVQMAQFPILVKIVPLTSLTKKKKKKITKYLLLLKMMTLTLSIHDGDISLLQNLPN
jgi:branched-subunit amino acid permease